MKIKSSETVFGKPLQTEIKVKRKGKRGSQKTTHPLESGVILSYPGKGNSSRPHLSKDGGNLEGNREQRIAQPPEGGATLSSQIEKKDMGMEIDPTQNEDSQKGMISPIGKGNTKEEG